MSLQTLDPVVVRAGVPRVDLLPAEVREARAFRRLRTGLTAGLLATVGMAAGAYVITLGHVATAGEALAVEQDRTVLLQAEQAPYADVPRIVAEVEVARQVRADVAAYDVPWYSLLDALATRTPEGLSLTSLTLSVTPPSAAAAPAVPAADPAAAPAAPAADPAAVPAGADPLTVPGVGTLSANGETHSQAHVALWLEQLATIPGVAAPNLTSSTFDPGTGRVTFSSTATLTDAALRSSR